MKLAARSCRKDERKRRIAEMQRIAGKCLVAECLVAIFRRCVASRLYEWVLRCAMGPTWQNLGGFAQGIVPKHLKPPHDTKRGGAKARRFCHEKHFVVVCAKRNLCKKSELARPRAQTQTCPNTTAHKKTTARLTQWCKSNRRSLHLTKLFPT